MPLSLALLVLGLSLLQGDDVTWSHGGIVRGSLSKPVLALAFTGDEFGDGTAHIREVLDRQGIKGTFFFTGRFYRNSDFADDIRLGVELTDPTPRVVLVDAESINDIDATAVITIKELEQELQRMGIDLRFAQVKTPVMQIMRRAGIGRAPHQRRDVPTVDGTRWECGAGESRQGG